jgi:uncharacterized protein
MYIYLHGFASGPGSTKAKDLHSRCDRVGIDLQLPDLNQGDFSHLTISRQVAQIVELLPKDGSPVTLIGSSLGGWTAAIIARDYPQVERIVLLAPAFDFLDHWLPKIGEVQLNSWAQNGYLPIYHHAAKNPLPLHYNFVVDARQYHFFTSDRVLPTLIVHGIHDDVIPIDSSRKFANKHPWVELIEVDSNHSLLDKSDSPLETLHERIWQEISIFLGFAESSP